jgi:hypothetical protein
MPLTKCPRQDSNLRTRDAGLTGYAQSYANATDLHTIPKPRLHRRRGRLAGAEIASLEQAGCTYLGL